MGLNVLFSFGFSALFRTIGWLPHGGLALASSLATALEVTVLFMILCKRLNGINDQRILYGGLQSIDGMLAMSLAVFLSMRLFSGYSAWLLTVVGIVAGWMIYVLTMLALRIPELTLLVGAVGQKVGNFEKQ